MRTLIVSDLHLGSVSGADLVRRAALRGPLLAAVAEVQRVVLLGDVLELRHGPPREALAHARAFFEDLGAALADGELVIVAGNHDHALVEPWLARRGEQPDPDELTVEQLLEPEEVSSGYAQLARWSAPARVRIAYPGLWVRPDVYAMHGHYLDCHLTVPTLERLSVGAMARLLGRHPESFERVADYEGVGAPVFAWRDAVARQERTGGALNGMATVNAWRALGGSRAPAEESSEAAGEFAQIARLRALGQRAGSAARVLRRRAIVGAFPLAVGALNRAGLGPLRPNISTGELRRAGLAAMGEVAARLGLADAHVVFGHTHRPGPLPGDSADEWRGRSGARLCNTGSWTYAGIFLGGAPGESPYWPGSCVLVEDSGAPVVMRLLQDRTREQIRPPRRL